MPRPVYNNVLFLCADPDRYTVMRYAIKLRCKAAMINCNTVDLALDEFYRLADDSQRFVRLIIAASVDGETSHPAWLSRAAERFPQTPILAWDKDCVWRMPVHPAGIERSMMMSSLIDAYFRLRLVTNPAVKVG